MHTRFVKVLHIASKPAVAIGGSVAIALALIALAWYVTSVSPSGAYTAAVMAPIQEAVDVSGPVQGAETTDLSFQISGQVVSIPVTVGERVGAGQVLVALSGGAQSASLNGAEANLETAQANLAALQAGTRPEVLSIDQSAVRAALQSSYVSADGAVHATVDPLLNNPRTANPTLTFTIPDANLTSTILAERVALEPVLAAWGTQITDPSFVTSNPGSNAETAEQTLTQVNAFLGDVANALTKAQSAGSLPAATVAGDESSVAAARASVAGALSSLTAANGALTLANAGATPEAVAIASAQVDSAKAAVESAQVASNETVLVAPIAGTVTAQNAHLGETVAPGVPLVSMESASAFEAKAPVSESDIGKVKVGDAVIATFDAYPGVQFPATITAVDPAATMSNGVSSYQVTATFSANDPRIQSGLTAHLAIITATASSALVIPASAVISDGTAHFVYLKNGTKAPVTLGVESADGNVQILSGLPLGAQVLTFGSAQ